MQGETVLQQLSATLLQISFEDIPPEVITEGKKLLADLLIVAAAGRAEKSCQNLLSAVAPSHGKSTVWFDFKSAGRAATDATFINTLHAGALDYDSLNGAVHADLVTLPAAWAVAQHADRSPKELMTAWFVATEVVSRLSRCATGISKGWSGTSIYGGIGAAAASGLLLGLDASQLTHALGLAAVQASGTQQANIEKTLAKRLQPAFAARNGVFSALLAQAGATAPAQALEGKFGLRTLYQPGDDTELIGGWDKAWQVTDTALKGFPVCACSHAAIHALLTLKADIRDIRDIAEVHATISPFMHRLVGGDFDTTGSPEVIAQFNLKYHLASALVYGPLTLNHTLPGAINDPNVLALISRVYVHIDSANPHELAPASVLIKFNNGQTLSHTCQYLPGSPDMPLSDDTWRAKAEACAERADMSTEHLNRLISRIQQFPELLTLEQVWE